MIDLLPKTLLLKSFRTFNWPKVLPINFTLLISTACNSRCLTCNIWREKHNDLVLDEWKKILRTIGKWPYWFTISGGEPFLQPHLVDLVMAVYHYCHPRVITLPTNSLLVEKIASDAQKILENCPKIQLFVNLSLDGVGDKHDQIRGVPGNFSKVLVNLQNLKELKKRYRKLTLGIHSVFSKFNINEAKELIDFALSLEPDQYITEIAEQRVELGTIGLDITPDYESYSRVVNYLVKRIKSKKYQGMALLTESFRLEYYDFVKKWLKREKIQMKDFAGWASCEITSWGEVWPSCIKGVNLGNLRDNDYNFPKIWFGAKAETARQVIKKKPDSFPLANAFYSSALCNYSVLVKALLNLLKLVKI